MCGVGGAFRQAGDVVTRGVARYRNGAYEAMGGGLQNDVHRLFVVDLGGGPQLYASVTAPTTASLFRWSGSAWIALPGLNEVPTDLVAFDEGGGTQLYAAVFDFSAPFHDVRRFDGSTWHPVTPLFDWDVHALEVYDDGSGPALYAAGAFTSAGIAARGIAKRVSNAWVEVGGGLHPAVVGEQSSARDLAVWNDGTGDRLVVVGDFARAGTTPADNVAAWDGTQWSALGAGIGREVQSVRQVALASGTKLVFGGLFATAGGVAARAPAFYDGANWSSIGSALGHALPDTARANRSVVHDDGTGAKLCVGGIFEVAGGEPASCIAAWDETAWSALGSARAVGGFVGAIERHEGSLYVGGRFGVAGDRVVRDVARFDGTTWSPVGSVAGPVKTVLALCSADVGDGNRLYAGGRYTQIGGVAADRIAQWDGTAWAALPGGGISGGSGVGPAVFALEKFQSGATPRLVVAGNFAQAGGVAAASIARWSPSTGWSAMGAGFPSSTVHALALFDAGSGPALYAGGTFAGGVARWNGAVWTVVPAGPSGPVYALAPYGGAAERRLYVGGAFGAVGPASTSNFAAYDGANWDVFGQGVFGTTNSAVNALHVLDDGSGGGARLHLAGSFARAGGVLAASVASWDGASFASAAGGGVDGPVSALGSFADAQGPALYAGGSFATTSTGVAASFARFGRDGLAGCEPVTGTAVCDGSSSGSGCPCGNAGLPGHGCASGVNANGALLAATGAANLGQDTVRLVASGLPNATPVLWYQGNPTSAPAFFGDGLLCVSPGLIGWHGRAVGGIAQTGFGTGFGTRISTYGYVTSSSTRVYQAWYRNSTPAFCTSAGANTTNGLRIEWAAK